MTRSANPSSNRVSVIEGEVEMIRLADWLSFAQRGDNERRQSNTADTTAVPALDNA